MKPRAVEFENLCRKITSNITLRVAYTFKSFFAWWTELISIYFGATVYVE